MNYDPTKSGEPDNSNDVLVPAGHADPIPTDELPAASPLHDDRPSVARRQGRFWFPAILLLAVILVAVALGQDRGQGQPHGEPADRVPAPRAPEAPR